MDSMIRQQQDEECENSRLQDTKKDYDMKLKVIMLDREKRRLEFKEIIKDMYSENEVEKLNIKQQRLFRIPILYRTEKESKEVIKLEKMMKRAEKRCCNLEDELYVDYDFFEFIPEGCEKRFAADVEDTIEKGTFNELLLLADVYIKIKDKDYVYPLNKEDSNRFISHLLLNYTDQDLEKGVLYT